MYLPRTRVTPPPIPAGFVSRPGLLDALDKCDDRALTLVCAPPGYGKSLLLSYWVRERPRGTIPLETAVKILTSEPAAVYGLRDRGAIEPGLKADLNLVDPLAVAPREMEVVHDLPAGAKRVLQRTDGFVATIVDGVVVQRDGVDTGARPGRVVRSA